MVLSFAEPGYEPPADDTVAADTLPERPVVAGEIVILDPNRIEIGPRLRRIDDAFAAAVGLSMKKDGQFHPVFVCEDGDDWRLAGFGGHRVIGARMAGIGIESRVVSPNMEAALRREAAENVFRRSNDPLEQASAIAELVRAHKLRAGIDPDKDGRSASAAARRRKAVKDEAADANDTLSLVYGWSDEVAEQIGVSKRTVERKLQIYRGITPSRVAFLRADRPDITANESQLRAIAKLEDAKQGYVVEMLCRRDGRAKSVSEALARMGGSNNAGDPAAKRLSTFIGTFSRMGLTEKKGALAELRSLLPAGFELVSKGDGA